MAIRQFELIYDDVETLGGFKVAWIMGFFDDENSTERQTAYIIIVKASKYSKLFTVEYLIIKPGTKKGVQQYSQYDVFNNIPEAMEYIKQEQTKNAIN